MSLIVVIGTNLGNREYNLDQAIKELSHKFHLIKKSNIYESPAVDYLNQPDFYNQALEFEIPSTTPIETLNIMLEIENKLGRSRTIDKGPRIIDIDIIFWGTEEIEQKGLVVPHPSWSDRSFVILPIKELPYFKILEKRFIIPKRFNNSAQKRQS